MRVVHIKNHKCDVYIGRPSKWGNPFSVEEYGRVIAIAKYEEYVLSNLRNGIWSEEDILELDGKILGCWCYPKSCHGDILIKIIQKIKNARKFNMKYIELIQRK